MTEKALWKKRRKGYVKWNQNSIGWDVVFGSSLKLELYHHETLEMLEIIITLNYPSHPTAQVWDAVAAESNKRGLSGMAFV
jgi:hypothetical protein